MRPPHTLSRQRASAARHAHAATCAARRALRLRGWALLGGSLCLFAFLFLLLLRFLPAVSMHETRSLLPHADPAERGQA